MEPAGRALTRDVATTGWLSRTLWRCRDAYREWRNRWLSSPAFQRWSAKFPLTRPIATRRASAVFDLTAGFVYSQVLHAVVELELLPMLSGTPRSLEEIATRARLPIPAAHRLLEAARSLDVLEARSAGRYGLGVHGAALSANPGALAMIRHHALFYRDLADPVALLRRDGADTELQRFWAYARGAAPTVGDQSAAAYSTLMASSLSLLAEDVLEAYPFGRHRRLLDVGGGEGAFVAAVGAAHPRLRRVLFDLPPVAARARARLAAEPAGADPVEIAAGDMFATPLPSGADVVTLVRVLHDHDDDRALAVLVAIAAAIEPGGVLVIAEPLADARDAAPMGAAYFGLYLWAMGQGRPRRAEELAALLRAAGFSEIAERSTRRPMLTGLLTARAPTTPRSPTMPGQIR
jgi:demethylspheroidene O-methyltransferase